MTSLRWTELALQLRKSNNILLELCWKLEWLLSGISRKIHVFNLPSDIRVTYSADGIIWSANTLVLVMITVIGFELALHPLKLNYKLLELERFIKRLLNATLRSFSDVGHFCRLGTRNLQLFASIKAKDFKLKRGDYS